MKIKYLTPATLILLFIFSYCTNESRIYTQVQIDPNIKLIVQNEIIDTIQKQRGCSYHFLSKEDSKYNLNDTLYEISKDTLDFRRYEASWIILEDTTLIVGNEVRSDGTFGFRVEIIDNRAKTFGYLRTHVMLSNLSIDTTDKNLYNSILIPTSESKIILSELPDSISDEEIYGYLEFQTEEFYIFENTFNEDEATKLESKIKIYNQIHFKSTKCLKF